MSNLRMLLATVLTLSPKNLMGVFHQPPGWARVKGYSNQFCWNSRYVTLYPSRPAADHEFADIGKSRGGEQVQAQLR